MEGKSSTPLVTFCIKYICPLERSFLLFTLLCEGKDTNFNKNLSPRYVK